MSRPRLVALLLALITLAVYLPVTHYDFLNYDDDGYVTDNPVVENGLTLSGIEWAFTTGTASNWHPLTWISHMTDCTLFGLNPGPQHLVNVIFHSANVALLFILLLRLTGKLWPSTFVAALFAWHPLHVESVAWIAERKDVLSAFFGLLSLLSYARYARAGSRRSYWLALVFFALGLMSKPMLVTLPGVMLLLDFWPLQRFSLATFRARFLMEKIPFVLLTIASSVITFLVQRHGQAVVSLSQIPMSFRLENAVVATGSYLTKLFWPTPLAVIYPMELIPFGKFILAAALLMLVSAWVWMARKYNCCWLVGWCWFLGTLVPVIGIVQVGSAAMADRYTYIPSIGIFMAVIFGLDTFLGHAPHIKKVIPYAASVVLIGYTAMMEWQLHYWRDTETLFRHTTAVTHGNAKAHLDLAIALEHQGRLAAALTEYRATESLNPQHYELHFNLGCMLGDLGRHAEALAEFRKALRYEPQNAVWLSAAGTELARLGRDSEALQSFAEAIRLQPNYASPHLESAKIYFQQGQNARAVAELHAAAQAEPDNFQTLATVAHYLAANQSAGARDGDLALSLANKANNLSGQIQPMVWDVLGMAYADTGNFSNAVACAQQAVALAQAAGLNNVEEIRGHLDKYENHQPWRESFTDTNSPVNNPSTIHLNSVIDKTGFALPEK